MSIYQETINNFLELLETNPSLFSAQDKTELEKIIAFLPDDENLPYEILKNLANKIIEWCENHLEIDAALAKLEDELNEQETNKEQLPGIKEGKVLPPNENINKTTLLNAIRYEEKK